MPQISLITHKTNLGHCIILKILANIRWHVIYISFNISNNASSLFCIKMILNKNCTSIFSSWFTIKTTKIFSFISCLFSGFFSHDEDSVRKYIKKYSLSFLFIIQKKKYPNLIRFFFILAVVRLLLLYRRVNIILKL